jgi:ketosteroid isomerase-like protein
MRTTRFALLGSLAVAAITGCTAAGAGHDFSAADSTAVAASIEKWRATLLARDFDAWGTTTSTDVEMYAPNTKPIVGRAAAVDYVKAYPEITGFTTTIREIMGHADNAHAHGSFTIDLKLPDGTAVHDTGSFMSVFARGDGTWPHHRVMWNSHLPAPPPPPPAPTTRR